MIVFDFVKCVEGGLRVLPQKNLGLNGVKLCNSRHQKHGMNCSLTRAPRGTDRSPEYNEHFLLKVRFLSKSESMTVKFVKSVRTANNHDISIQDTRMHSVCCCCIPI